MKFDKLKPNEIIEVQEFDDSGKKVKRKYIVKPIKIFRNSVITELEE